MINTKVPILLCVNHIILYLYVPDSIKIGSTNNFVCDYSNNIKVLYLAQNCYHLIKLQEILSRFESLIIMKQLKIATSKFVTTEIQKFVLILHFYSPSAYNYVRFALNTNLPHPITLSFYSSVDGTTEFTSKSLNVIKMLGNGNPKQKRVVSVHVGGFKFKLEYSGQLFFSQWFELKGKCQINYQNLTLSIPV